MIMDNSSGFKHPLFELLYSLSHSFSKFQHIDYVPMIGECLPLYNDIHALVDQLLSSFIKRENMNPARDQQEQKEMSSSRLYAKFTRKAKSLHQEVNRLNMAKKNEQDADNLAQAILATERKVKNWRKDYHELGERATHAMQQVMSLLINLKNSVEVKPEEQSDQKILAEMKKQPYKLQMCYNFLNFKSLLQSEIEERGYNFEEKFQKRKKALMLELQKVKLKDILSNREKDLPKDLIKIEGILESTNSMIKKLKKSKEDITPQAMIEMSRILFKTEDGLNELQNQSKKQKFEGGSQINNKQIAKMIAPLFNDLFEKSHSNQLIYKVKAFSPQIAIYDIVRKNIKKIKVNFSVPQCAGLAHVENCLFIAGGLTASQMYHREVKRVNSKGEAQIFTMLPQAKSTFPLVHYQHGNALITLGGFSGAQLYEANQLLLQSKKWIELPQVRQQVVYSGVILNQNHLYSFSGQNSSNFSVFMLILGGDYNQWTQVSIHGFSGSVNRGSYRNTVQNIGAVAVKNTIICFSSQTTHILAENQPYNGSQLISQGSYAGLNINRDQQTVKEDDGKVYVFSNQNPPEIHTFNPAQKQWAKIYIQ